MDFIRGKRYIPKIKKGEIIQDEENDIDEESERESEEYDEQEYSLSGEEPQGKEAPISRRVNEVFPAEISDAILAVLKQCPNYSCTIDSLTTRVLRQLGVVTRGKPREEFEKRVMRILVTLDNKDMVEKYRSKNKRVRLVQ